MHKIYSEESQTHHFTRARYFLLLNAMKNIIALSAYGTLLGSSSIIFSGDAFDLPTSRTTGGPDVTSASVTLSGITGTLAISSLGSSGDTSLESFDDSGGSTNGFLIGIGDRNIAGTDSNSLADTEIGAGDVISLSFNTAVRLISYEYLAFGSGTETGRGQGSVVTVGSTVFNNGNFFGGLRNGLQVVNQVVAAGDEILFGAATGNSPVDGTAAAVEGQGLYYRITVEAVPEPSATLLGALGALSLISRRKR